MKLRYSIVLALTGCIAFVTASPVDCECGFEDLGGGCALISGLNASTLPGRICNLPTDRSCEVDEEEGTAECICGCYWEGESCDERVEVSTASIAISLVLPAAVVAGCLLWILRREYKTNFSTWNLPAKYCVDSPWSWCGPRIILIFRFCISILGWSLLLTRAIDTGADEFRFFTVWNWILLTLYFSLGCFLSTKYLFYPDERDRLNIIERVFWIMLVVETVSTVLVLIVLWAVLYPTVSPETQEILRGFSSINRHAMNVVYMYLDFALIYLPIHFHQYVYLILWGGVYALFHSALVVYGLSLEDSYTCWAYFFLRIEDPLFVVWVIGLLAGYFVFFWIGYRASRIKMGFIESSTELTSKEKEELTSP